jgi:hypothetical protein
MKEFYEAPVTQVLVVKVEGMVCTSPGLENYNKQDYYEE